MKKIAKAEEDLKVIQIRKKAVQELIEPLEDIGDDLGTRETKTPLEIFDHIWDKIFPKPVQKMGVLPIIFFLALAFLCGSAIYFSDEVVRPPKKEKRKSESKVIYVPTSLPQPEPQRNGNGSRQRREQSSSEVELTVSIVVDTLTFIAHPLDEDGFALYADNICTPTDKANGAIFFAIDEAEDSVWISLDDREYEAYKLPLRPTAEEIKIGEVAKDLPKGPRIGEAVCHNFVSYYENKPTTFFVIFFKEKKIKKKVAV